VPEIDNANKGHGATNMCMIKNKFIAEWA
jgi:hypothetical protein